MAICSGWSGGTLKGHKIFGRAKMVPELLFALGFMTVYYPLFGWWGLIAVFWAFGWMETGHANALPWGAGNHNPDRENTLSPVVKKLSDWLGIEYYSKDYARLFMAVKGLLISLPVGGSGVFFWPLGYEIGHRVKNHLVSEMASGAGIGLSIIIFSYMVGI